MSEYWPTAEMMVSTGTANSDPSTGTGRLRPDASGSPSAILRSVNVLRSFPEDAIETGAQRYWMSTPSSSVSSISASEAGISSRVRR